MDIFSELREQVESLDSLLDEGVGDLTGAMRGLSDEQLVRALEAAAGAVRGLGRIEAIAAGIMAERSTREAGQEGMARVRGHRSPAEFLQVITGGSKSEARQRIRVGQSVLDATEPTTDPATGAGAVGTSGARVVPAWHAPLADALMRGQVSSAQSDAIRRGLGEPPTDATGTVDDDTRDAWSTAAGQLANEAEHRTVEELRDEARLIRDRLDPEGAERRFLERYEARSFRTWTDADGRRRGSISFDDDGHALVRSIFDSALRPRRGGPRFVDAAEVEVAQALVEDPRSLDQLSYDLLADLLRAGALADAKGVHGTRRAGVRIVTVTGSAGGYTEDGLVSLPQPDIDQRVCDTGAVPVTVDAGGDPLNVGRERRLFTPAQRVALSVRDGGCRWHGCDRPSSYCEAHHVDPYSEGGRTDIDRGILLCRFHHMQLHHSGWRISRDGRRQFVLHDPGGGAVNLEPRLALRYAFGDVDPPPRRFRPAA